MPRFSSSYQPARNRHPAKHPPTAAMKKRHKIPAKVAARINKKRRGSNK
jgi:hypothetical protein